jgi:hypothetical protein
MRAQIETMKKEMDVQVLEAKAPLIDQLTEKDKVIASMQ